MSNKSQMLLDRGIGFVDNQDSVFQFSIVEKRVMSDINIEVILESVSHHDFELSNESRVASQNLHLLLENRSDVERH